MSGLAGGLTPILLTSFLPALPSFPVPFEWASAWLLSAGLLGMGFRDMLGGGDDESVGEPSADPDFLGDELSASMDDDIDGFDGFDEGLGMDDDPLADVEPRFDDLEAELADLASTVSSVRGEHESMRESVEDIEDNVRKLLEVYEVVTQGVNPFVDDPPQAGQGGGSFSLLDGEDEPPADDTAEAGVEDLFEDDTPDESAAETEEEGLTFEDLKSEFEYVGEDGPEETPTAEGEPETLALDAPPGSDTGAGETPAPASPDEGDRRGKPYLADLPGGYGAELLVMEWLRFLVSESSVADALRAIRYYRTVDWISEEAALHLQTVLSGTLSAHERATPDGGLPSELSVDHHSRSLEYISQLGGFDSNRQRGPVAGGLTLDRRGQKEDHGVQR